MIIYNVNTNARDTLEYCHKGIDCTNDIIGNEGAIKCNPDAVLEGLIWYNEKDETYYATAETIAWWQDHLAVLTEIDDLIDKVREMGVSWDDIQACEVEMGDCESDALKQRDQLLKLLQNAISPTDWVDYLIQIGCIGGGVDHQFEDEQDYARWVFETPITEVRQVLADQPCDTPIAERMYEWAEELLS
jgi:hypothetical protein